MQYTEIIKIIMETFDEGENLKLEKKNGRIIISVKQEKNVWTKEQEQWLNDNVIKRLDNVDKRLDNVEVKLNNLEAKLNAVADDSKPPRWFAEWNQMEFQPLKKDVQDMKNTPTMKKELAEMNK